MINSMVPAEESGINGQVGCETSLEESVLQELQGVMDQMTENTRICFRDALYRLAKNSKHGVTQYQNAMQRTSQSAISRSERTQTRESETNTIDRAIANLMFSKMDFNARNMNFETTVLPADAEVPIVGTRNMHNVLKG